MLKTFFIVIITLVLFTNATFAAVEIFGSDLKILASNGSQMTGWLWVDSNGITLYPSPISLATSTVTSANNSVNKTLTAWCPIGFRVMSGGGEVTAGNAPGIVLNQGFPTATTSGWTVILQEAVTVAGNWTARAHAVCLKN